MSARSISTEANPQTMAHLLKLVAALRDENGRLCASVPPGRAMNGLDK